MRHTAIFVTALALSTLVTTHRAYSATPIDNLLLTSDYDVNADATYARVTHIERRAGTDAAAQQIAQFAVTYSPSLDRLEVVEAYTRKPDGRVLRVQDTAIRDQSPPGDPALQTFADNRQRVILFPHVAAGDTVVLTFRDTVFRERFKGIFSTAHTFVRAEAWDDVRITIKVPRSLPLQFEAVGQTARR